MAKTKKSTGSPPTVKLGEVAKLLRLPPGVRDEKTKRGGDKVKVISIVDLPVAGYISNIKDSITLSKEKFGSIKKYRIEPFDVLMSIQGTVGRVGVVPESLSGDVIANISLLAIRFRENQRDNGIALLQYLKSQAGRKLITKLQKGNTIKRINVKELASSKIPGLTADIKRQSKAVFDKELAILKQINGLYDSLEDTKKSYLS